jgi:predicted porin
MQKTFKLSGICAAVALVTCTSTAALAASGLTIYGTLDASVTRDTLKTSPTTVVANGATVAAGSKVSTTGLTNGVMTQSFIGFQGVEDLGGGLEVSFKLESYLDIDTGATSSNNLTNSPLSGSNSYNARDNGGFWGRNAYVGIKTNYGLLRLGQMDSLGYLSAERFSPFGASKLTPSRIFYKTDYYSQGWSNAVAYFAKVGKVGAAAMYSAKETTNATNPGLGAKWATTVGYFDDQFSASLGYENNKSSVGVAPTVAAPNATNFPATNESWFLNSFYDFGVAKLFAQYGYGKLDRKALTSLDAVSKGYQLGVSVPVGERFKVMASFSNGKINLESESPLTAAYDGVKARDIKIFTVGSTYDLSKRTNVYAVFSNEKNDYQLPAPPLVAREVKETTFALGVRHSF